MKPTRTTTDGDPLGPDRPETDAAAAARAYLDRWERHVVHLALGREDPPRDRRPT